MQNTTAYEQLHLFVTPQKFIIQPLDADEILVIDRLNVDITTTYDRSVIPLGVTPTLIHGLWGILRLPCTGSSSSNSSSGGSAHLLTIKGRSLIGNLWGHSVWRIESTDVIPFTSEPESPDSDSSDAAQYLAMIRDVIRTPSFYYSYTLDLTHSAQRLSDTSPEFRSLPLAERADERFVWNQQLLHDVRAFPKYALPVMHGFVSIWSSVYQDRAFDYAIVSRRSRFRAGVRFYMRGADQFGCAANFVETEQLLQAQGQKFSFVLTRGSVPLVWSQYPNLLYKPKPEFAPQPDRQAAVFVAHFSDQVFTHKYGRQIVLNLLDNKGVEKELCTKFGQHCALPELSGGSETKFEMVRYEHFDFHRECSRMRWDRLSLLLDRTETDYAGMGYFHIGADGSVSRHQSSVFRVNCIDCLDRTNVVQGLLARRALLDQFRSLGWHLGPDGRLSEGIERVLKCVWADNADALAVQYTGTGALKADFTRTGKRTKYGAMMDGYNSLLRYAKNNFSDGFRQDSIDLFLGNYQPEQGQSSPFATARGQRSWRTWAMPAALVCGLAMLLIRLMVLSNAHWSEVTLHCLICMALIAVALTGIIRHGREFVDRPKLCLKIGPAAEVNAQEKKTL